jgi:hypothetical protein
VFFLGDLNYRLDYGDPLDFRDEVPGDAVAGRFQHDLMHAHNSGSYAPLVAADQLRRMQQIGRAFVDFHEADIQFPPTFKVRHCRHTHLPLHAAYRDTPAGQGPAAAYAVSPCAASTHATAGRVGGGVEDHVCQLGTSQQCLAR